MRHLPLLPCRFLRHLGFFGLALQVASCSPRARSQDWNVILLSLDTLRADHLGAWGYPNGTSPSLDRLARRGTAFRTCVAQASSTLPSHRSVFQSRVASLTSQDAPMLAEILTEAGWHCVAFTGGGNVSGELGFARGFDRYDEKDGGLAWAVPSFLRWVDDSTGEPYFAFLHTYDVHLPYDPPTPYESIFDPGYSGPVAGGSTRELCRKIRRVKEYQAFEGEVSLDAADRRHLVALYDGEIRNMDAWIGSLVAELEERDLLERTLIVIMSDHGEEFWDHGSLIHSHTVYQELVHVPLAMVFPEKFSAKSPVALVNETVRNLEIAPTILEAVGLPAASGHEGISLLPWIFGSQPKSHLAAVSEMKALKSLLDYPFKLVIGAEARALFDLEADPGELVNVASEHLSRVEALEGALAKEVAAQDVAELSSDERSQALRARLQALGYVDVD